jgi:hypothetical protein
MSLVEESPTLLKSGPAAGQTPPLKVSNGVWVISAPNTIGAMPLCEGIRSNPAPGHS